MSDRERAADTSGESPYLGLASFSEADHARFFGRETEAEALFDRVREERLVVVYGLSGLGKTSLLQAGLVPRLRAHDFLPVLVRLSHAEGAPSLAEQVRQRLAEEIAAQGVEGRAPEAGEGLWEYLHRVPLWSPRNRLLTLTLVFDPFEEAFTGGTPEAELRRFAAALGDLAEERIPAELEERVARGGEEGWLQRAAVRLVVSLREDYLADLEELRSEIPSLGRARLRVTQMDGEQALAAALLPAEHEGFLEDVVAERIVRAVAAPRVGGAGDASLAELRVEPAVLSLVCSKLDSRRRARGEPRISEELVTGSREEILRDFFEESLAGTPRGLRTLIEDELVTESGHRKPLARVDALARPGIDDGLLDTLVDRRLLRAGERYGAHQVELIHDVLGPIVLASRRERREREARRRRRRRVFASVGAGAVVLALAGGVTWRERQQRQRFEAQWERANALLDDVLFDLYDGLEPIGRLDLLEQPARAALQYLSSIPPYESDAGRERIRSVVLDRVGDILVSQGRLAEAQSSYQASLAIAERLAAQDPTNAQWQRDLSVSQERIGDVLQAQGRLAEAQSSYQASLAIRERLAAQDPTNAQWQRDLSVSHNKIGDVLKAQGRLAEAQSSYQASLAIAERLAAQDPTNAQWQRDLSVSHNRIGDVLQAQGRLAEAQSSYQASLAIAERLAAQDPTNAQWQRDLSVSQERIGDVLQAQGRLAEAQSSHQASLAIRERLAAQDPTNAEWQRNLAVSQLKLASLAEGRGRSDEARGFYRSALALFEKLLAANPGWKQLEDDIAWVRERLAALESDRTAAR